MSAIPEFFNNVFPYPVAGLPWTVVFPILDNTGALVTGAAGLDSERSIDGNTFSDCASEAAEIPSGSGMYYLTLANTETACNILSVIVKTSTTNAKTTPMVFYPKPAMSVNLGTCQGGGSNTVTLATTASAVDQFYRGMAVHVTIDGTDEYRFISNYVGSTKVATVTAAWVTAAPDSNDDYGIFVTEELAVALVNVMAWNSAQVATPLVAGIPTVQPVDQGWRQP